MRVLTWNCNMAFKRKYEKICSYNPDLLIIPECEHPDKFQNKFYSNSLWIGKNRSKGLGVFSLNDTEISLHEVYSEEYEYVLPIKVVIRKV